MTVHKSQSSTLAKVWADLSHCSLQQIFVALSRVQNLKDLIIEPFEWSKIQKLQSRPGKKTRESREQRFEEEQRLRNISRKMEEMFPVHKDQEIQKEEIDIDMIGSADIDHLMDVDD